MKSSEPMEKTTCPNLKAKLAVVPTVPGNSSMSLLLKCLRKTSILIILNLEKRERSSTMIILNI